MRRTLAVMMACCFLGAALAAAADEKKVQFIDLQPKVNQKLKDDFHSGTQGNSLGTLPTGEQTFEGVKFKIGEGAIQLGGTNVQDKPLKVEGIKVDQPFARLHILHATGFSTDDDTEIGQFTVIYEDKSQEKIPIVYGKDVRDWWYRDDSPGVTRGKVAWKGENDYAKSLDSKIRLYLTTWKNPHPDKKVVGIEYSANKDLPTAPFCVAMTAEDN